MKLLTSGCAQVSPLFQKSSSASVFRETHSITCGERCRKTRAGRLFATTAGGLATDTEKLGCVRPGRAVAAASIHANAEQVERHRLHIVLVGQNDDRRRADKAPLAIECSEIERDLGFRGPQDAARGAARQISLELMPYGHAAAEF